MSRQKHLYSKVFDGYNFDMGIDRDFQHQKVWTDRIQETKQVQQMKQIDKIFQGIVKQRIFGTIIAQKHRLSNQEYIKLDRANKTINGSFRNTNTLLFGSKFHDQSFTMSPQNTVSKELNQNNNMSRINFMTARKRSTLQPLSIKSCRNSTQSKKQSIMNIIDQSRVFQTSKRINHYNPNNDPQYQSGSKTPNPTLNFNLTKFPSYQKQKTPYNRSKTDSKTIPSCKSIPSKKLTKQSSIMLLKEMNLDNNDLFEEHFKNLSATPNIFLYDIKVTKQAIINRTKDVANPRLIEYFFYFFGFPITGGMTFRQYKKGIEKAFNSPISLIYFFTFRVLDESGNGFLTISDLFRFLQSYPQTSYIEKEIFNIRKRINEVAQQLMKMEDEKKHVRPTLEEILIVNHKLKADEVTELLRQSIKQDINKGAGQVKLTCYSQSILSLEHDVGFRLKQYELQNQKSESQAMNAKNTDKDNLIFNQDGLRFSQFVQIFNGHRPKIFCFLVNILTGLKNDVYQ